MQQGVSKLCKPCMLAKLPGTDPNKPVKTVCIKSPQKVPSTSLLNKQKAYLSAWKKKMPTWSTLTPAQQEAKRRALKESHMGKGQP